ncbi:MAG TPA: NAD(P)(+) transhydrogenase (Re/Si-specific) subunit beta [Terriglobales bacterium]|nr:NAD(P)(+) transhydrogenase (Re/Si-specific) subunit beta [Terriglobales bacterium]
MNPQAIIDATDFVAAFLFIFGLKRMSSPLTARNGIVLAGWGVLVATLASFLYLFGIAPAAQPHLGVNLKLALGALVIGVAWAWWSGQRVAMTAMPQMVALYNGMGGGAAACIAAMELASGAGMASGRMVITLLGALIGAVSLSGSLIAWAKLDGKINKTLYLKGQQAINGLVLAATVLVGLYLLLRGGAVAPGLVVGYFAGALVYGVLMTLPIGGADMPVLISLYNAFTGLAVGMEGYVLQKPVLMIAGVLVGAAGGLLTLLMARAMNRSVANVLFSRFGATGGAAAAGEIQGSMKPVEASDAAINMRYASKVLIIPGYGLAVAQAQYKLYEFVKLLQAAGVEVKFAVHPVAGRMPGHMDVLLAEAGVPYDMMHELEEINDEFSSTDVALVIGANDVVNPAARTDKSSPIYGMPILNADKAHQVYVIKRGQGKGYSGVENELFFADNCNMVYGDAQAVLVKFIAAVKEMGAAA